jgi:isopentenyl diphosphate isomerase/L-lactate dehydrogenase-like FMN-dependent dehydrogenase
LPVLTQTQWDWYKELTTMTSLPIILKGIQTVEDVELAIENGVPAIILSNHGGRQIDDTRSSLEIAIEIYKKDPSLFDKIEIMADGGVRYGTDAIKLLALGVKAVGLGRPFMYANVLGQPGVEHAIELMRFELEIDLANLGVPALQKLDTSFVDYNPSYWLM